MNIIEIIVLVAALLSFFFATIGVSSQYNLTSLGLFFITIFVMILHLG